ncbi:hypothetical protein [Streptomyces eurythermus]|uniref:hypothetical protein n=1 Tax=Streptomyces eurythermus TaxID=42237 RepID=UPI0036FA08F3
MRFPGAVDAEDARRERAAALHARIEPLDARLSRLSEEWRLLTEGGARPEARAQVLTSQAALQEEIAALYEELTAAEPGLADEHRGSAERARSNAASDREYAELLAAKAQAGTEAVPGERGTARRRRRRRGGVAVSRSRQAALLARWSPASPSS